MRAGIQLTLLGLFIFISLSFNILSGLKSGFEGYKHYTGTLDTNMRITFDLISQNETIEGYYYYGFPVPGEESYFQFGKTLAIEGVIEGNRFEIHEKINPQSLFIGRFDSDGNMQGKWTRQTYQKEVIFDLSENYSQGSIPLKTYEYFDHHYVVQNKVTHKDMPKAEIDIRFLFPTNASKTMTDTFNFYISKFTLDTIIKFSVPQTLAKTLTNIFFTSYQTTTEGIPNIELLASFNWIKKYSTNVLYNDNHLLSLQLEKYAYTGGAHGMGIQENIVFDLKKESRLRLKDLFYEGFEPRLNALVDKKLRRLNDLSPDENLKEAGFLVDEITYTQNFFINNDGITFYYNVYEIAPYASGPLEIFIPFNEIRGLLRSSGPVTWIQ